MRGDMQTPLQTFIVQALRNTRFVEGLRMDETNLPRSASGIVEPVGPEQGKQPSAGASVVFFGDPAQVAEGFAIALRAMGIDQSEPRE
jgi:hypothetical protein